MEKWNRGYERVISAQRSNPWEPPLPVFQPDRREIAEGGQSPRSHPPPPALRSLWSQRPLLASPIFLIIRLYFPANLQGDKPPPSFIRLYKFYVILSKANASHRSGSASFKSQLYWILKQESRLACILIVNGATESSLNLLGWFKYK